jgi:polar amino acid transport system substrate-binding protein
MSHRLFARAAALLSATAVAVSLAACAPVATPGTSTDSDAGYVTKGKLTVATSEPAYYPYIVNDATPQDGQGFESAVAYAVADELGFNKKDVVWVRTTFDEAIQPGAKSFDFNIQQFSITDERKANVDFSSSYYSAPQAVITIEGSAAEDASSIADLKDLLIGAATGTTSFTAIEKTIAPTKGAQGFNSNDDAVLALTNGTVDAIVVDLPTAFYLTGAQLDNGILIGQLPASAGISDKWGLVLTKDSPLTAKVSAAVDAITKNGKLAEITDKWLGSDAGAPVLK